MGTQPLICPIMQATGVGENNNNTGNLKQGDIGGAEERTLKVLTSAHSHSEPSLSNMLGLTQESTATESEFTLKKQPLFSRHQQRNAYKYKHDEQNSFRTKEH